MKKYFKYIIAAALLIGGIGISTITTYAAPNPEVCDPNSPCVYTGVARTTNTTPIKSIYIKVYYSNGAWLAEVRETATGQVTATLVPIPDGDGKWHLNYKSDAYYFNM